MTRKLEKLITDLNNYVLFLRSGGCPHTDPLEGGGLCATCENDLADHINVLVALVDRYEDVDRIPD